jgi:hypothetical protein
MEKFLVLIVATIAMAIKSIKRFFSGTMRVGPAEQKPPVSP